MKNNVISSVFENKLFSFSLGSGAVIAGAGELIINIRISYEK